MSRAIVIRGAGVISPLGRSLEGARRSFLAGGHLFQRRNYSGSAEWVAPLDPEQSELLERIRRERNLYHELDRSVLMAIAAARGACASAGWRATKGVGVIMGSSRGATATFEDQYSRFRGHASLRADVSTSPTTTLGNISSAVAQDLLCDGFESSHSITCSTALHGVLNAAAWIRSGMGDRFLVGGSEAALTDFTIAQMKALRIYTSADDADFPCRPLANTDAGLNTFALGEGAAVFALEAGDAGKKGLGLAQIDGLGWGVEALTSLTSMSLKGDSFISSMSKALESQATPQPIDLIVGHAPGTVMGDRSEAAAVQQVFGKDCPLLVSPKWQIGHTFGASGAFGMLYAIALLNGDTLRIPAYRREIVQAVPRVVSRVMVNAAGFGGNSCSVILSRV